MWLLSTPFGQRGFFWEEWERGGPSWERVSAPATECPRIPAEFLEEERRSLGERSFRQEYLCEFGDAEGFLFDRALIEACLSDDLEPLEV